MGAGRCLPPPPTFFDCPAAVASQKGRNLFGLCRQRKIRRRKKLVWCQLPLGRCKDADAKRERERCKVRSAARRAECQAADENRRQNGMGNVTISSSPEHPTGLTTGNRTTKRRIPSREKLLLLFCLGSVIHSSWKMVRAKCRVHYFCYELDWTDRPMDRSAADLFFCCKDEKDLESSVGGEVMRMNN
ncbi:hypothetical protein JTE90_013340 [Oedothorax gibbosus]|uniref:Uncharacterized protein n=1 Tax=Oedothorax gibbosus TaxID=931172 RepID=A0AAV6VDA7_9ARAC|nr:hypothetical protein JTE90_013340 [Oedothorax gibbosus]